MMNELQKFITEISSDLEGLSKEHNFGFALLRWSKTEPYWCVFACELQQNSISGIGGHLCIDREANMHEVLSLLVESEYPIKFYDGYFTE